APGIPRSYPPIVKCRWEEQSWEKYCSLGTSREKLFPMGSPFASLGPYTKGAMCTNSLTPSAGIHCVRSHTFRTGTIPIQSIMILNWFRSPLYPSRSAFSEPTARSALILMGILFRSFDTQRVRLSFSLNTRPDWTMGLNLRHSTLPYLVLSTSFPKYLSWN